MPATLSAPRLSLATPAQSNTKTRKPARFRRRRIVAALLHLSPANISGFETCGGRTLGCTAACLNSAGHGGIGAVFDARGVLLKANGVQAARIRRTRRLFESRAEFMRDLVRDVERLANRVKGRRYEMAAFRPNGTSDLDWTVIPCERNGKAYRNIFEAFPSVQFYDYTKVRARMFAFLRGELPRNYHLTFSRAETLANQITAREVLLAGGNVAVVFAVKPGERLPDVWNGHIVIDGDMHDYRFADPKAAPGQLGYVVGLRAKGKAKGSVSGFVVAV